MNDAITNAVYWLVWGLATLGYLFLALLFLYIVARVLSAAIIRSVRRYRDKQG